MIRLFVVLISLLISLASAEDCLLKNPISIYVPQDAHRFKIEFFNSYRIITRGNDKILLYNREKILPCTTDLYKISTPVKKIILTSSTYLPSLEMLSEEQTLIGFQGKKYIYSNRFLKEKITDISLPLVTEEILKIKPDLVMSYEQSGLGIKKINDLRKAGIPVVLNEDYQELTPLGRAEWLVYNAAFFNKEKIAISKFMEIKAQYLDIKKKQSLIFPKKKVLVGDIQNGKWVSCGGNSDLGHLISDAGGEMEFASDSHSTQSISLETFYKNSNSPDIWMPQNSWDNKKFIDKDSRYKKLHTVNVYNNRNKVSPSGANDYWEMGMARPDLILLDLAAIFYPEQFLKHQLFWYKKL